MIIKYVFTLIKKRISPKRAVKIFNSTKLSRKQYTRMLRKAGVELPGVKINIVTPFYFKKGNLEIGEDTFINTGCIFLDDNKITIGKKCGIGPGVHIYTSTHPVHHLARMNGETILGPVVINDMVWVGGNSTILPGICIGEGAVIAAGSVVTKNVAPYSLYAGNPAVFKKKIE